MSFLNEKDFLALKSKANKYDRRAKKASLEGNQKKLKAALEKAEKIWWLLARST